MWTLNEFWNEFSKDDLLSVCKIANYELFSKYKDEVEVSYVGLVKEKYFFISCVRKENIDIGDIWKFYLFVLEHNLNGLLYFDGKLSERYLGMCSKVQNISTPYMELKLVTAKIFKYLCNCCNYGTDIKQNFSRHNKGNQHFENVKLCNLYACGFCGQVFENRHKKAYHMKICIDKKSEVIEEEKKTVVVKIVKVKDGDRMRHLGVGIEFYTELID
jgi:hypothetical protein